MLKTPLSPVPTPGAAQQTLALTFGCCLIGCEGFMGLTFTADIHMWHLSFICFPEVQSNGWLLLYVVMVITNIKLFTLDLMIYASISIILHIIIILRGIC